MRERIELQQHVDSSEESESYDSEDSQTIENREGKEKDKFANTNGGDTSVGGSLEQRAECRNQLLTPADRGTAPVLAVSPGRRRPDPLAGLLQPGLAGVHRAAGYQASMRLLLRPRPASATSVAQPGPGPPTRSRPASATSVAQPGPGPPTRSRPASAISRFSVANRTESPLCQADEGRLPTTAPSPASVPAISLSPSPTSTASTPATPVTRYKPQNGRIKNGAVKNGRIEKEGKSEPNKVKKKRSTELAKSQNNVNGKTIGLVST